MANKKPTYAELENRVKELEKLHKKESKAKERLKELKKELAFTWKENINMSRLIKNLRATANMPELHLDSNWNIVGYSNSFLSITDKVVDFSIQKKSLRDFLNEGDFDKIQQYLEKIKKLEMLPYDQGQPWNLRYSGPHSGDKTSESWITYSKEYCSRWEIKKDQGKLKIIHRPHVRDKVDCYLMSGEEFEGADEDIKVVYKIRTAGEKENILDLSLVISGASGRESNYPDIVGYTACTGSYNNTEARIQRLGANIIVVPEKLELSTEYEITVERTGGRIKRWIKNLKTGFEAHPLEMIDSNAIYDRQNHVGFTTFSGEAEFYDIEIYTRKSLFSIEQFKIPFNVEVGLRDDILSKRIFSLRLGYDSYIDSTFTTLMFEDITERKRIEEALRESEEKFRLISEQSLMAVVIIQDFRIQYANETLSRFSEYSLEEIYNWKFENLVKMIHPEDREFVIEQSTRKQVGEKDIVPHYSYRFIIKSGETKWIELYSNTVTYKGNPADLITFIDINERKQADEALQESEEKYRKLFEMESDAIFLIEKKTGQILEVNKAATALYGFTRQELLRMKNTDISVEPQNTRRATVEQWTKIPIRYHRKKDGTIFPVEIYASHFTWQGKEVHIAAIRDITERLEARREIEKQKEFLQKVIDNNPCMIYVKDSQGRIIMANQRMANNFGTTVEELIGKTVFDLFPASEITQAMHEKDHKEDMELINQAREKIEGEEQFIDKFGKLRWAYTIKLPLMFENDRVSQIIVVSTDITELKRLEEESIKAGKLESLGIMAGGIAHDFNNILTSILGNISLARMLSGSPDKIPEFLAEAEKASIRAKDLTHQLLTFSRGGAPVKKPLAVNELIRECTGFALSGSNVKYEFSAVGDLWPVEVDEGQFSQVIQNLIINAEQAMPNGGILKIIAENAVLQPEDSPSLPGGRYVSIILKDQGVGIPRDILPKIFDPYFTTKQKGSGLGLATAYSIIKKHDGLITVKSEPGVGTTFQIYLPASSRQISEKKVSVDKISLPESRILVMDDEQVVRDVASKMLEMMGQEVELAMDGAEALDKCQKARISGRPFDIVIMDLTIPGGMGGKEAVVKLAEIDPQVKAIVSSGYSNDPVLADFKKYGFSGIVSKPYNFEALKEAIYKVMKEKERGGRS